MDGVRAAEDVEIPGGEEAGAERASFRGDDDPGYGHDLGWVWWRGEDMTRLENRPGLRCGRMEWKWVSLLFRQVWELFVYY